MLAVHKRDENCFGYLLPFLSLSLSIEPPLMARIYVCVCVYARRVHVRLFIPHRAEEKPLCVRIISEHSLNTICLITNWNFAEY